MDHIFHASIKCNFRCDYRLLQSARTLWEYSIYIRMYNDSKEYKQPIKVNKPHDTLRMAGHFHVEKLSQGSVKMVESRRLDIKLRKCPARSKATYRIMLVTGCVMEYYKSFHEAEALA